MTADTDFAIAPFVSMVPIVSKKILYHYDNRIESIKKIKETKETERPRRPRDRERGLGQ